MEFIIDYCNGFNETVECADLEEAKSLAVDGMSYTQANVNIKSKDGDLLATSHWYGVEPGEDDEVLERFGNRGFYSSWVE